MIEVTLYDNFVHHASFYLIGFEQLAKTGKIKLTYRHGVDNPLPDSEKRSKAIVFSARQNGITRTAMIDIGDNFESVKVNILRLLNFTFKFNYNEAYIRDNIPPEEAAKLFPLGFHVPMYPENWMGNQHALRWLTAGLLSERSASPRKRLDTALDFYRTWRDASSKTTSLDEYRSYREPKVVTSDLFWNVSYWRPKWEASGNASNERIKAMQILKKIDASGKYDMKYGFIDKTEVREDFPDYVLDDSPRYGAYIRAVGTAKMTLITPGIYECFSYRIAEQLAMGRFALMQKHVNKSYVPLEDGKHVVFFEPDMSDLEEKVVYYLEHDDERERIARQAAEFFDTYTAPMKQVEYMLQTMFPS